MMLRKAVTGVVAGLAAAAVVMTLGLAGCGGDNGANSSEGDGGEPSAKTYTITFNANGGTVSPTSGKTGTDGKLASLPTPTRSGYTFDGWYTAATGGNSVTLSKVYSANTTIYARWTQTGEGGGGDSTVTTYTITFNANGGTVSPTSGKTGTDGKLASLPTPTRSDYTFDGWYTAETGGDSVTLNKVYSANATIYARWTQIEEGGGNYKSVNIGTQTWMAENLNIDVRGSVCYDNDPANCAKYGRLYTLAAAFNACPSGWHLPSDAQWTTLTDLVGLYAGTKLKSKTGWNTNGTDDYGFSALPGGSGNMDGTFDNVGNIGYWWSATIYNDVNAWNRSMRHDGEGVNRARSYREYLFSVRCVKDGGGDTDAYTITFNANGGTVSPTSGKTGTDGKLASLPTPTRSDYTFTGWYTSLSGGDSVTLSKVYSANTTIYARWATPKTNFTDSRDNTVYTKVTIGTQTWMAENLNYDVPNDTTDVCYENSASNCAMYGRLYNWATAMNIDKSYNNKAWNGSDVNHQGICPVGWHLPFDAEWTTLTKFVGGAAGTKLKSKTGWESSSKVPAGSDTYGFSALPGGGGDREYGFNDAGSYGNWWGSTEINGVFAWVWYMLYYNEDVSVYNRQKTDQYSVRCVQD